MKEIRKKSVRPIYAIGVVWVVWAIFLPLYHISHFILAIGFSVVAYRVTKLFSPDKVTLVQEPVKPKTTGNPQLDALIAEKEAAISEMRRLNDNIKDEKISAQIDALELLTDKIITHVVKSPEKLPQIRKFMNYYLPTTLKVLNAYDRMGEAGVKGEHIDGTMLKVENMMDTIVSAFSKQLDNLFSAEALDISTDITVLEGMLSREGLSGDGFAAKSKQKSASDVELKL